MRIIILTLSALCAATLLALAQNFSDVDAILKESARIRIQLQKDSDSWKLAEGEYKEHIKYLQERLARIDNNLKELKAEDQKVREINNAAEQKVFRDEDYYNQLCQYLNGVYEKMVSNPQARAIMQANNCVEENFTSRPAGEKFRIISKVFDHLKAADTQVSKNAGTVSTGLFVRGYAEASEDVSTLKVERDWKGDK